MISTEQNTTIYINHQITSFQQHDSYKKIRFVTE